ncbi:MAG: S8 family serine peptidase [Richelia sp. RM2_1_2]|nr:S8 family serine peptidase [Richelia sp. SM1_7_0]NJN06683.1 S8 family serine peptidase [Richelia sp. RM1_1_1]NJO27600.1 S8 family serine peptidase [Richelia sp. SL_2_1]NJO59516.1 S8 family serine peptidase [Richelia sp. RM2_1_2]
MQSNLNNGFNNSGRTMPSLDMNSPSAPREMPSSAMDAASAYGHMQKVLVELRVPSNQGVLAASRTAAQINVSSFRFDTSYEPITVNSSSEQLSTLRANNEETVIVRGIIEENDIQQLESQANVIKVYKDTPIAPFDIALLEKNRDLVVPMDGAQNCPIGTCDCSPTTAKGTIADVAKYFGADQIWAAGFKGEGIVVGVVDGGITAEGRDIGPSETILRVKNVIGGPASDWGTTAKEWGEHGNMSATDVLGMAPAAKLYDCRISGGDAISNALKVFDWAIKQYQTDGTPQILTNSWGIYQENWDEFYANNPEHPFTRKVVEAIELGILVLFAAGNCGGSCPSQRCGTDTGSGKSIWGANGHPLVMTVGAVNKEEQFIGYSSQGPASLDPNKPDFCSVSHFKGYFASDNGTSAACPIAAGVVALLKQAKSDLNQQEAKELLKSTAKNIGEPGFDHHSGAGIIQAKAAFDQLLPQQPKWHEWESWGGNSFYAPAVVSAEENHLDAFIVGGDSAIYRKSWHQDKNPGEWEKLDGFSLGTPAVLSRNQQNIDLFIISQERTLQRKCWNGKTWSEWENLGGLCKHGVTATSWGSNRLDVFSVAADNAVWHKFWNGESWSEWLSLGGISLGTPAAVSLQENSIDVFIRGCDHAIYRKSWNGTSWSNNWESLGGLWLYSPAVTVNTNTINIFTVGTDNAIHRKTCDRATTSEWQNLGGASISAPAALAWGQNRIDIFAVGGDNALYHKWLS